jgi:hypothetical protein
MGTPKQIEAARRNGARSKGPVTAEGKTRSSQNAIKHGLAADPGMLMATEHDDNYDQLLQGYMDTYQPANGPEHDLVCQIVTASWKLRRIGRIEANLIEVQIDNQIKQLNEDEEETGGRLEARAFRNLAAGRSVDLLLRYAAAARRAYDAALKTLRDLQRERRKSEIQNEPDSAQAPKQSTAYKSPRGTVVPFASPQPEAVVDAVGQDFHPAVPILSVPPGESPERRSWTSAEAV